MKVEITGLEELPEGKQQGIGAAWLRVLYFENVKVDGVNIKFEAE